MCIYGYMRWRGCGHVAQDEWLDCQRKRTGRSCLTSETGQPTETREGPGYRFFGPDGFIEDCVHCRNEQRRSRSHRPRRGGW